MPDKRNIQQIEDGISQVFDKSDDHVTIKIVSDLD